MKKIKDEETLMRYLGKLYQKYEFHDFSESTRIEEAQGKYCHDEFVVDMKRILTQLSPLYAEIIQYDFLCVKDEDWWKNKYDEKTHEQLKNMAVKAFFHCLYI